MQPNKRAKRQAQFKRLDDRLQKLYAQSKWKFSLLGIGLSALTFGVLWVVGTLLEIICRAIFRH